MLYLPTVTEKKFQMCHVDFPERDAVTLSQGQSNFIHVFFKCSGQGRTMKQIGGGESSSKQLN